VVGMDIIFSEAADSAGDAAFAEAMRSAGNVVLASSAVFGVDEEPPPGPLGRLQGAVDMLEPLPEFAEAAADIGSISVLEDDDGTLRRYTVVVRYRDGIYPSLAQAMAGVAVDDAEGESVIEGDGTMLINWGALSRAAIERVSFSDVLGYGPEEVRRLFEDRVVLVAAAYTGGTDYGATPLDPRTAMAYAQLYAAHTLVTGERLRQAGRIMPIAVALLVVGLLSTQIPSRHPLQLLGMGAALAGVLVAGVMGLFFFNNIILGPTLPVLAIGVVVSGYGLEEWWVTNARLRQRNIELQETLDTLRRTRSAKERMEAELNIAREIQFSMLPSRFPPFPDRHEFDLYATLMPARQVGGDFYDFFLIDEHHLCICIADVSDKGVPAALFMTVAKAILKSHAGREMSPAAILTEANAELSINNEASMFVSVWFGIVDLRTGGLSFSNAGHNPPYILRANGELVRIETLHGPVLAAIDMAVFGEDRLELGPGDLFLLYTDGVPEAMDPDGNAYGDARLARLIETGAPDSAEELVRAIAEDTGIFQGPSQADDLTVLALGYHGPDGEVTAEDAATGARSSEPAAVTDQAEGDAP
jgi:serine phosphatase RsbU (regulator of sigma subunit)